MADHAGMMQDDQPTAPDTADGALLHKAYSGHLLPGEQIEAFRRFEHIFPTRMVRRGMIARALPRRDAVFPALSFLSNGKQCDLYDYVSRNRGVGLLVLKDGAIALENHELGHDERTRWMSMSMAKSITSILVGVAINDGLIGSLDDPLTRYLPELTASGYDGVSVRQLLQMASGVRWNEDYLDITSDRRRMLDLQIAQQPGAIMAGLPRVAEPGAVWNYSTGETHVAGALIRAAAGRPVADYLSERIWSRLGMDGDAFWWLESPGGLEVAGSGLSATLRDYGRFGLFVANGGVIDGERVLPENWVAESGNCAIVAPVRGYYGLMWWPIAGSDGGYGDGAFRAGGIFGQYIYINPAERVVVVVWSARSKPMGADAIDDNDFFNAVVDALR
jgi:CubicO group peptidase (beta-lactamase class C family)